MVTIANGVVFNDTHVVTTTELLRLSFYGTGNENVIIAFAPSVERRGLKVLNDFKQNGTAKIQVYNNGVLIFEDSAYTDVQFEYAKNDTQNLVEQLNFTKSVSSLSTSTVSG